MARIKKKGQSGAARNYVTRNQAIRKLQISLPDFRQLCIWKGIYPREPRSKKKVSKSSTPSTTFYYAKDIQFLMHEPLVQRFREQKVLEKKITRALGRGDVSDAKRLDDNASRPERTGKPRYTLDHLVRERYPAFIDALRDLDDCLCMLFLFANLPSTSSVPAKMIARCERLCLEFQHYIIISQSLTRSFLSIKGIYYQANIQGEDITWLVPYRFNQRILGDVDFRIMGSFVEFYMTLLGFVNFRLYTTRGLKYPPKFDPTKDANSAELGAFTLEGLSLVEPAELKQLTDAPHKPDPEVQAAVNDVLKTLKDDADEDEVVGEDFAVAAEPTGDLDKFEPVAEGGDVLPQPVSHNSAGSLFSKTTVYLSRETPRQPLEFLLKAFGCKRVGWDAVLGDGAFTTDELDPSITHQIVDRPLVQATMEEGGDGEDNQTSQKLDVNKRVPGRTYVQPQWVWDSVNDQELKDAHLYAPGASLPPHLSPFVKRVEGAYDPTMPLELQETEAEALEAAEDDADETAEGMDVASPEDEEEEEEEEEDDDDEGEDVEEFRGFDGEQSDGRGVGDDNDEDDEEALSKEPSPDAEDDSGEENEAALRQKELEAELAGAPVQSNVKDAKTKAREKARKELQKKARDEAEEIERAKGMLSKKKRRLYEQMEYTNRKKSAEDMKLRAKRRKIEKEKREGVMK